VLDPLVDVRRCCHTSGRRQAQRSKIVSEKWSSKPVPIAVSTRVREELEGLRIGIGLVPIGGFVHDRDVNAARNLLLLRGVASSSLLKKSPPFSEGKTLTEHLGFRCAAWLTDAEKCSLAVADYRKRADEPTNSSRYGASCCPRGGVDRLRPQFLRPSADRRLAAGAPRWLSDRRTRAFGRGSP